jgi:ribokinase
MNKKILVIGSSNTDMVIKTRRFPQPGETILGGTFFMFAGGKGGNQAVAAARLGGDVTFVCKTGNDIFGTNAIEGYKKEGIDTGAILRDEHQPSGVAMITVNEEGENNIVVGSGANYSFSIEDADRLLPIIRDAGIVLLQLEIPLTTVEKIVTLAKSASIKVVLNPAPAEVLSDTLLNGLYLITPNETEAEMLTGIRVEDMEGARLAANYLKEKGVQHVIITLGSKGAFASTGEFEGLVAAPVVKAVDSTAAGDVFNGALAAALAGNRGLQESIVFACKAAALSVTRMGAQSSAPYLHEIK